MTALPTTVLADPAGPLADFLGAAGNLLHRLLALPVQAAAHARAMDQLQYFEFVVFWILGAFVIGITAWFVVRYRHRPTDPAAPRTRKIQSPLWLELGVAGSLLGIFMLWWMIGFRQYRARYDPPPDAMDVYAVGKQWVWKFTYPDGPRSTGVLYLPANRPIRVILTARDVIHSLFIPAFRIKQDAVPGRYTSIWFTPTRIGRYEIMCAEFCGDGHGRMRATAVVLPAEQFDRWLEGTAPQESRALQAPGLVPAGEAAQTNLPSLARKGLEIAGEKGCLSCHTVDGRRHLAPTWEGLYGSRVPLAGGDTVIADPAYLTESMMDPDVKIVDGFTPMMPSFQGLLTPAETAALVEYIRSIGGTP